MSLIELSVMTKFIVDYLAQVALGTFFLFIIFLFIAINKRVIKFIWGE